MVSPVMGVILNKLTASGKLRKSGDGYLARCPAHDDHDPSLKVTESDGKILLHCHANCTTESITAALGLTLADLFTDREPPPPMPLPFPRKPGAGETLVATYLYTDLRTGAVAEKGRFELPEVSPDGKHKKTFRWRWQGEQGWHGGPEMAHLALWGHELITAAPDAATIYFCEGEAATLACRAAGLLAVTHAGGASTKDFGASLEVLRGRTVALWPDNDATGREYMATVHARIRDLAAAVSIIAVPVPPRGDAVEYFTAGGTVANLTVGAMALTGTSVEYLAADNIRLRVPSPLGTITFNFEELEKKPRSLDAELTITLDGPGTDRTPYSERINLLSASARTDLRRDLETVYGKEHGWAKLLNTVFATVRERFLTYDRSIDVYDVAPLSEGELFFHNPLIPLNAVTILFGDRGSTKSLIAEGITFCTAMGEPFMGQRMPQGPVLYCDYEDNERNFRRRLDRLAEGLGMALLPGAVHYLNLMGMPIADAARAIRAKVVADGIVLVIIDSLGPATGGDPASAEAAIATMQALRSLGVTVLCLAHVPKNHSGDQPKDPFGSVYYSNLSRRTWYIERVQEEASDQVDVGLYCKKVNDGPLPRPIAYLISFTGLNGPVTITGQSITDVPELQGRRAVKWQVWDALVYGQRRTIPDLTERLTPEGATAAEVKALQKAIENALKDASRFTIVGEYAPQRGGRPLNLWGRVRVESEG